MPKTIEILNSRLKQKQRTGSYQDDYKICLGVEGGGMMGVISCAMLMALKDLELLDLFDVYVGGSAGSINLAYTLAGHPEEALSVYYDHMINGKHIDAFNLVKGKYAIDLKALEKILKKLTPSPVSELVTDYNDKFFVSLTQLNPDQGKLMSAGEAGDKLLDYLLAGAIIPYIDGKPKKLDGITYCDGGFAYPDLKIAAIELSCTHLFVLSTHPEKVKVASRYDNFGGNAYTKILSRRYQGLENLWQRQIQYSAHLSKSYGLKTKQVKTHSAAIRKSQHNVGTFSTDQWIVIDGARKGYESVVKLFLKEATIGLVPEIL